MFASTRRFGLALLAGTALTLAVPVARAATYTYTAADQNGNLNDTANYSPAGVPGSGDTAIFGNAGELDTGLMSTTNTTIGTVSFTGSNEYILTTMPTGSLTITALQNSATGQMEDLRANTTDLNIGTISNTGSAGEAFGSGNGSIVSLGGVISGAAPVTLYSGTVALGSANTLTGLATIGSANDAVTVQAEAANVLADAQGVRLISSYGQPTVLNSNNFNQTFQNLSGNAGTQIQLGSGNLTVAGGANTTFAGVISGTGSVTYGGTGTLKLTGANTYSGGSNINHGSTLDVLTTSLPAAGGVADNGTLQFADTGAGAYGGNISGTGAVQITGGGTVTLSGSNSYTGSTTIENASTLAIGNGEGLGSGLVFGTGDGTLQTSSGINLIVAPLTLAGNGTFDTAGNVTVLNGAIGGAGALTAASSSGTGTLELTSTNTYSGGTAIDANTAIVTYSTNALGTGVVTLNDPTAVLNLNGTSQTVAGFNGNGAVTGLTAGSTLTLNGGSLGYFYTGMLSGAGTLTHSGSGIQILAGANTGFSGPVSLNAGTLEVGTNSALGTGTITFNGGTLSPANAGVTISNAAILGSAGGTINTGGGFLNFVSQNNFTYAGAITGTGTLAVTGIGMLTLSNANNSYSGGTNLSGGTTLDLGANNAAGTGGLTVQGALPPFQPVSTLALGTFNQAVTTLSGGGNITSTGGTLTVQSGAFSGTYSGTGGLVKTGVGTLTLSGANTYGGGTNVQAGTLALGVDNAAGTGTLIVAAGATFAQGGYSQQVTGLSGAGTITSSGGTLTNTGIGSFSGTATSSAAFAQSGGMQVLDGTDTFASTTISGGALQIGDASNSGATLTSPVSVQGGGMLMGHGTVIGNVANMGGTVRPGGSIGTLTVNGNYQQDTNSTLAIEVSPVAASRLAVTGSASLAGTLVLTTDPGTYAAGTQYQIVTAAGGVSGQFQTVTERGQAVPLSEVYTPNAVDLRVADVTGPAMPTISFAMGQQTPNEANALGAITSILPASETGAFQSGLIALGQSTGVNGTPQLAGVLGELRADLATIDLANLTSFNNFIVERMDRRQGLTSTMEVNNTLPGLFGNGLDGIQLADNGSSDQPLFGGMLDDDQPSIWFHGYGVLGTLGDEAGFAEAQYRTGGLVGGADLKVTDTTLVGLALAYEHTDLNLSGDTAENNIDTYRVSLYGSSKLDPVGVPLTVDAALGYAFNDYHNNDFLPLANTGLQQTSRHDGSELTAEAGVSQDVHIAQDLVSGALTVVPRVGVEYDNISQNPYTTTGAPVAGLNFSTNGSTLNALRSTLGARADLKLKTNDGTVVTPELRATYLHDFMDTNAPLSTSFTGAPEAGFRVSGVHPGRDAALVGTGATVGFSENISATIGYDAAVRDRELDHTVQVGIKYTW